MNWIGRISKYLSFLFRRRQLEKEMDEEMRLHVELKTQANVNAGMPPDEARLAAIEAARSSAQSWAIYYSTVGVICKHAIKESEGIRTASETKYNLKEA